MKPRIVILSAFLTPFRSGAEAMVEEVALRLHRTHEITIVTAKLRRSLPRRDLLHGTVPVVRVGVGAPLDKWLFPLLAPLAARRVRPQLVHAVLETFAGAALVACRMLCPRATRLLTLQSTNRRLFPRMIHRSPDALTAISSVLTARAARHGRKNVTLIPNGIDLPAITHACGTVARVPGRILFAGRLEPMKGIDTLLRAFAIVRSSHPEATLRIAGDGSQRAVLEGLAKDLGVAHSVTFAGYVPVPRVYEEYAAASVFCGLSRSEAFGNVFLEAQAACCAVVAARTGGIPDIVRDDETGILTEPDNPEEAAYAILRFLSDAQMRERIVSQSISHARAYDWEAISRRYAETYASLLSRRSLPGQEAP